MFRRSSWLSAKSESSSVPSAVRSESSSVPSPVPLDFLEEFRDELSSFQSDEKKNDRRTSSSKSSLYRDDFHPTNDAAFNPFELIPSWGFEDNAEKCKDEPEMKEDKDIETPSMLETKKTDFEDQLDQNHPDTLEQPGSKKVGQWSKISSRKKNQFKYHGLVNERRSSKSKKKIKKPADPSFEKPKVEDRDDTGKTEHQPENIPHFQSIPMDELSAFDNGPFVNDSFHTRMSDENPRKEGKTLNKSNSNLRLAMQDRLNNSSPMLDFMERDQPPCDAVPFESASRKTPYIATSKNAKADTKKSYQKLKEDNKADKLRSKTKDLVPADDKKSYHKLKEENKIHRAKGKTKDVVTADDKKSYHKLKEDRKTRIPEGKTKDVATAHDKKSNYKQTKESKSEGQKENSKDEIEEYRTSDGDYSTVTSGKTENLPLLKAWGINVVDVDCNNCGNAKEKKKQEKKQEKKKKRAKAKKKVVEELWDRNKFYWKYESVEEQQREHQEQLNNLVLKIDPESNDAPKDDGFIDMPLGIQLSTITEGDEDLTACCSPRSMRSNKSGSIGAGSVQKDGKSSSNTPVGSLLDNTNNLDAVVSLSEEDEVEGFPLKPEPAAFNNNKSPAGSLEKEPEQEQHKSSRRSKHRRKVSVSEIEIVELDDSGTDGSKHSKGEISDITEDYLHIPLSSPLYAKVLKAFREAQKNGGKLKPEETSYLRFV